ncbi:hypothetical protein BDB00DRAFT_840508, partial [Zychaea mexicana]|uniref:uncharacterized protein n=1 Tax=Zychaea mexicana TaxID=64656 RepID=UPI0022FE56FE
GPLISLIPLVNNHSLNNLTTSILRKTVYTHHHCSYNFQELNAYCHTLDPPRSKTTATIPPHTIIIAVHLIWASHWRYIFDDTPFDASRIYNMISTKEAAGKFTWGL